MRDNGPHPRAVMLQICLSAAVISAVPALRRLIRVFDSVPALLFHGNLGLSFCRCVFVPDPFPLWHACQFLPRSSLVRLPSVRFSGLGWVQGLLYPSNALKAPGDNPYPIAIASRALHLSSFEHLDGQGQGKGAGQVVQ